MNAEIVFIFPTLDGYSFNPATNKHKSEILPILEPDQQYATSQSLLSPLIRAQWIGGHKFFPRSNAVFVVGFVSRGIKNEIHRGSNSAWVATKSIVSEKSLSQREVAEHLKEVFGAFKSAVSAPEVCPPLFAAVEEYVAKAIGRTEIVNVIEQIQISIKESPELKRLSFWS